MLKKILIGFGIFILFMWILGSVIQPEEKIKEKPIQQKELIEKKPQKEFISESLFELHSVWFRGRMSDLQKEELWESRYKEKYVNWTGFVKSIDKGMLGGYSLLVIIRPDPYAFSADASIKMRKDQVDKLRKYSEGEGINFQAQLDGYGDILEYFYLKDGIIID